MVIVSHGVLFIHLNLGLLGSFHDVMILRHSDFYRRCRAHLIHANGYLEYLLGDLDYIGKNMFKIWRLGTVDVPLDMDDGALTTYNKMHVDYRVREE